MSIADYEPPSLAFKLNDKVSVTLRGVSTADLTKIVTSNFEDVTETWELFQVAQKAVYTTDGQRKLMLSLIQKCPALVAEVISLSAGEPDQVDRIAKWGIGLQMGCLQVIYNLTLQEAGGLKNLLASLEPMLPTLAKLSGNVLLGSLNQESVLEKLGAKPLH